ncbi:CDP-alcohol phosphatidyltransferase family protein [Orrella daihaiensis]|uniref:CDP-alcohol phosphatidyltransferase family protein n=1 Tax=Orrella daihaiensis TaxID=2782176 RepID=A0ABY4AMA5_9BURK|nr:CDP-alcohol phosphatidyltransferase family protein [Orrella daihaiensis]UOD51309.1 CDP-alcohol phosphatidyltransferase family protein [Orrella daihaiensis]
MSTLKLYLNRYRQLGLHHPAALEALLLWAAIVGASLAALPQAIDTWQHAGALLALSLLLAMGVLLLVFLGRHYPHRHFGWCNTVTLLRAAAVCWLAGLWFASPDAWQGTLAWGASIAGLLLLALDGVDGWLARRYGNSSSFGARFDMEVDSLLALVLALLVWQTGKVGAWVVLLGLFRPIFILAGWQWRKLAGDLPESFARKVICVIQVAALAIMLAPVTTPEVAVGLAAITMALLTWSFGRDTLWLLRQ